MNVSTNNSEIKVLVMDDDAAVRANIAAILTNEGYTVTQAATGESDLRQLREATIDLVLTTPQRTPETGRHIAATILAICPDVEVILMNAVGTGEHAAEIVHSDVSGYITTPCSSKQLLFTVQKVIERRLLKQEIARLRQHVAMSYGFDNIVGISRQIRQLKETAQRVAPTDITVLITGPSGTGKELLARAIHHHSNRRNGRFVSVDCSSLPEALLESELFGRTGNVNATARPGKKGLLEEADGGTLFLDEVANIPLTVQARLVRFLQDSEIGPSNTEPARKLSIRVLAATNQYLSELVSAGAFREDLFLRLSIVRISLPPLAERTEDIEMLIDYFLRKISHETKSRPVAISRPAVEKLLAHPWPGNVRELENTLKRAAALCAGNQIEASDISFIAGEKTAPFAPAPTGKVTLTVRGRRLDSEQRTLILKTLSENSWNFTRTAQELGIGRTTLWRKIKKYNLAKEVSANETIG